MTEQSSSAHVSTVSSKRPVREHVDIERDRRQREGDLLDEMKQLINQTRSTHSRNLSRSNLLQATSTKLQEINTKYQNSFVGPSFLSENERDFLQIETSNSFLFILSLQSNPIYPIVYVNEAIQRVLHSTVEQWIHQDFCTLIHPDDLQSVQTQLMSFNPQYPMPIKLKCRIRRDDGSYSIVFIDALFKYLDASFQPVIDNQQLAYPMLVAVCQLPLSVKYKEINEHFHQNLSSSSSSFHCRCSTSNWQIFLVDRAVSNIAHFSSDVFVGKSILDFIHPDQRTRIDEILTETNVLMISEVTNCYFIDPLTEQPILMTLSITPCIKTTKDPEIQQTDFLELRFESQTST